MGWNLSNIIVMARLSQSIDVTSNTFPRLQSFHLKVTDFARMIDRFLYMQLQALHMHVHIRSQACIFKWIFCSIKIKLNQQKIIIIIIISTPLI